MASEYLIIMVDSFGFALFCAACYFGVLNYRKFPLSRVLWSFFIISMLVGALMSLFVALEWMDFYPLAMDALEGAMTLVFTILLFAFTMVEKEETIIKTI
jgi:hypothetical protein